MFHHRRLDPKRCLAGSRCGSVSLQSFTLVPLPRRHTYDNFGSRPLAAFVRQWTDGGVSPEDVCILVRALPQAAESVLKRAFTKLGLSVRSQDALQDLLAEPLVRLVLDFFSVCLGRAPQSWVNLCQEAQRFRGGEEESVSSRRYLTLWAVLAPSCITTGISRRSTST